MQLAFVQTADQGAVDALLTALAQDLLAQGFNIGGVVQANTERPGQHHCDMDVTVLPNGPRIRISQALGTGSRGCRLDPAGLEEAVAAVESRLTDRTDLLILNKFGKHEAEGRGFVPLIGKALDRGIPVILGVNRLNRAAFDAFADGLAEDIAAEASALRAWCLDAICVPS